MFVLLCFDVSQFAYLHFTKKNSRTDDYDVELERYLNEINRLRRHMAAVTTPP